MSSAALPLNRLCLGYIYGKIQCKRSTNDPLSFFTISNVEVPGTWNLIIVHYVWKILLDNIQFIEFMCSINEKYLKKIVCIYLAMAFNY